jgi:hypothetical protein
MEEHFENSVGKNETEIRFFILFIRQLLGICPNAHKLMCGNIDDLES